MNDVRASSVILVQKDKLTSRGILPSSQELFDLMHLTTCEQAILSWRAHWMYCPVCLTTGNNNGDLDHPPTRVLN